MEDHLFSTRIATRLTIKHRPHYRELNGHSVHGLMAMDPYHFNINTEEVEKIIAVPMDFFLRDNRAEAKDRFPDGGDPYYPEYHFRGELIWGTTASVVANLISILGKRSVLHKRT